MVIALGIYLLLGLMYAFYFAYDIMGDKEYDKICEEGIFAPYISFLVVVVFGVLVAFIWPYVILRRCINGKGIFNKEDK